MSNFTEYVKLITEAGETLSAIQKVNEAINKLRENAAKPIEVKVKDSLKDAEESTKRNRKEKQSIHSEEDAAAQKRLAAAKAIKAMNAEAGGPAYNIRYGSRESIENAGKLNQQLAESTQRINRMADAYKHVERVAKDAQVELPKGLKERLATQTVNKVESAETLEEKQRIASVRERQAQEEEGERRILAQQKAEEKERLSAVKERQAQEEEAERRVLEMERERIRLVNERVQQEEEGARRVAQIERENERIKIEAERARRRQQAEQERIEREKARQIASSRQGGVAGMMGEIYRDTRRNLVYGGINKVEELGGEAFRADVNRDTTIENLRQAGRTNEQIKIMTQQANELSARFRTLTASEILMMEQHNVGAFGNFDQGMSNNALSASYIATRKSKVGEEKALDENLALLKVGEETGRIRDAGFMKKMYTAIAQTAQAEGAQFDPESFITTVRMMKSAKYMLSDDTMFGFMPFLNIMEKAGRSGNELASMFKTMTYSGTSLSKSITKEIAGTNLSNGKGGYSPVIAEDIAKGDFKGVIAEINKFFRQKNIDPTDESPANRVKETQELAKVYGNQNAQVFLEAIYENLPQFEKQRQQQQAAEGIKAGTNLDIRTVQGAMDAVKAQFDNASSTMMAPFNDGIKKFLNGITYLEIQANKNPGNTIAGLGGIAAGGLGAAIAAAVRDPQAATNTAMLTTIAANTGIMAGKTLATSGGKGVMGKVGQILGFGTAAVASYEAGSMVGEEIASLIAGRDRKKIYEAYTDPQKNKEYNDVTLGPDQQNIDEINKKINDKHYLANYAYGRHQTKDQALDDLRTQLAAAQAQLAADQKKAIPYNPNRILDGSGNIMVKPDYGVKTPPKLDSPELSSGIKHALEESGRSLTDGSSAVHAALTSSSGEISAGGSALAQAIASVAAQIAGISIPSGIGNSGGKTTPNVGLSQRGE